MSPINLLHVFSTFATGGPQVRLAAMANHWGKKYRHTIIAMDGVYDCAEKFDAGVEFELHRLEFTKGATRENVVLFWKKLKEWRPDLLLTYNFGAIEWALANFFGRHPHIHIEDGFGPDEADGRQLARRVWLRRAGLFFGKHLVVPSNTLHELATLNWRLPERKVSFIANGIDCARFANDAPDPEGPLFPRGDDEIIIGTLGALRPEKNLSRLVRAFAMLDTCPNARLVIAGSGTAGEDAKRQAHELGISQRVTFTGYVAKPERAYHLFDIFALSSDTEQMPLGMLEAMAAGLPVAAVDVGDVKRMLPLESTPYVYGCFDDELSRSMTQLCADAELRKKLGAVNRRHARKHYSLVRMCDEYDALFTRTARDTMLNQHETGSSGFMQFMKRLKPT
ncbi:MAG: glycosyltransferase family 4 protein [Alphaproteobacteria bacterium]|nr:glycosyltransferase family 4 protein [Alphaproteobacteria bacterium]